MTDKVNEQISAFMDGELPDAEKALLLKRLCHDANAAAAWQRYHLVSDVLHRNRATACPNNFASLVMEEILSKTGETTEMEPSGLPAPGVLTHWRKAFSGLAVAASVAAVTFAVLPGQQRPDAPMAPAVAQVGVSPTPAKLFSVMPVSNLSSPAIASKDEPLKKYMAIHAQQAGITGFKAPNTYARLIRTGNE